MGILSLEVYKEYMNINSTTNDTELNRYIGAVNKFIPSYCNREFTTYYATDKTEYFDGTMEQYFPNEYPIISVTSLKYSTEADGVYDSSLTAYTDYVIDDTGSSIISTKGQFIYATIPTNSMQLVYKGGYNQLPEEIKLAACLLVQYYASEDYTLRKSLAGASVDNVIIPDQSARLPQHIRLLLEHHRTLVI